jgi:hypothetical protein
MGRIAVKRTVSLEPELDRVVARNGKLVIIFTPRKKERR